MATTWTTNDDGIAELQKQAQQELGKVAQAVAAEARSLAPSKSGRLANSIAVGVNGEEVFVIAEAPYSLYVEMGTRHSPAQPFLRPALDKVKGG